MIAKHYNRLIEVLTDQKRECENLSEQAHQRNDMTHKAFHAGAAAAMQRAIDYAKDAQAGIL